MCTKIRRRLDDVVSQLREIRNCECKRNEPISQFLLLWKVVYNIISTHPVHNEDIRYIKLMWEYITDTIMCTEPETQELIYYGLTEPIIKEINQAMEMQANCDICQQCLLSRLSKTIKDYEEGKDRFCTIGQIMYTILISLDAKLPFTTKLVKEDGKNVIVITFIEWEDAQQGKINLISNERIKKVSKIEIDNEETYTVVQGAWMQLGFNVIVPLLKSIQNRK